MGDRFFSLFDVSHVFAADVVGFLLFFRLFRDCHNSTFIALLVLRLWNMLRKLNALLAIHSSFTLIVELFTISKILERDSFLTVTGIRVRTLTGREKVW